MASSQVTRGEGWSPECQTASEGAELQPHIPSKEKNVDLCVPLHTGYRVKRRKPIGNPRDLHLRLDISQTWKWELLCGITHRQLTNMKLILDFVFILSSPTYRMGRFSRAHCPGRGKEKGYPSAKRNSEIGMWIRLLTLVLWQELGNSENLQLIVGSESFRKIWPLTLCNC